MTDHDLGSLRRGCFQVGKVTARSEQEAAEADMRAAKAQVEATNEAEAKKKRLADG